MTALETAYQSCGGGATGGSARFPGRLPLRVAQIPLVELTDGYFIVAIVGFSVENLHILYSLGVLQQLLLALGYLGCHVSGL